MDKFLTKLEIFVLLVACLCHDLDHRGTNNAFQQKTESALSQLYSTSTMEHHHFDHSIMILQTEGNNIFQFLNAEDYRLALQMLETAILSTDLALYFKKRNAFFELVENSNCKWTKEEEKTLLRGMMMTACDVSAITKPWEVQRKVAELVASEFFEQGDLEKSQLNETPIAMMDREKKDQLPKMQVGFIDAICLPVYKDLATVEPQLMPLQSGCQGNRDNWQSLAEEHAIIRENEKTTDEKAMIETEKEKKLSKLASLEGGTPSNTPPPLTPAHTTEPQKVPMSPLAINDQKPTLTRQDAAAQEPSIPPAPVEETQTTKPAPVANNTTVDKNGKVVKAAAEPNGNNDVAALAKSNQRKTTKSKLCHVL